MPQIDPFERLPFSILRRAPAGALAAVGLVWAVAVGAGLAGLMRYQVTPGPAGAPPASWPAGSRIPRGAGRSTLVMLAHPRCPCTRASLDELAAIMSRAGDRTSAFVLFLAPRGVGADWARTDTVARARAIPGVSVLIDEEGVEAALFGASTSGQTVVYDATGKLRFSGGITGVRGEAGDNLGRRRLLAKLADETSDVGQAGVFGCALADGARAGSAN